MSATNDGGPAFPRTCGPGGGGFQDGMSLRDWFAGQALMGLNTSHVMHPPDCKTAALWAYEFADAMLAERSKR